MVRKLIKSQTMNLSSSTLLAPFALVALLQMKHVICDGPLQTLAMVRQKSHYLRPLGLVHAAIHGLATFAVLWSFGFGWQLMATAAVIESLLHYHIDYAKENVVKLGGWTPADGQFWWAMTFDQALHHFTYLAMGFLLFRL